MRLAAFVLLIGLAGCESTSHVTVPPVPHYDSPDALIAALELAYTKRDPDRFSGLLVNDPERNATYTFVLSEPTEEGETQWGYAVESRTHRRMFRPDDTPPGELAVPGELRVQSIDIRLTQQTAFVERVDLYSRDGGADGLLDPTVWRAEEALYAAEVFFELAGEVSYQVVGHATFVVLEDLRRPRNDSERWKLLLWEDRGTPPALSHDDPAQITETSWSRIKKLYL